MEFQDMSLPSYQIFFYMCCNTSLASTTIRNCLVRFLEVCSFICFFRGGFAQHYSCEHLPATSQLCGNSVIVQATASVGACAVDLSCVLVMTTTSRTLTVPLTMNVINESQISVYAAVIQDFTVNYISLIFLIHGGRC